MKIVFMGSPDFAVTSLQKLLESGHQILSVVTVPDKPAGRGRKLHASSVKEYAIQQGIPVLQPIKLSDPTFIEELKKLNAELFIVVAFRILPAEVFEIPIKGTLNVHGSLLPKYRGAAPINRAIINGESETGITIIRIEAKVDTGNILMQENTIIDPKMTAGILHDRLAEQGADLLVRTIHNLDSITPKKQDESLATKAPKLSKNTGHISFEKPAEIVFNLIRGLNPYPGAYAFLSDKIIKIFECEPLETNDLQYAAGEVFDVTRNSFCIACGSGGIRVYEVQLQGKKKMPVVDFFNGYKLEAGQILQ